MLCLYWFDADVYTGRTSYTPEYCGLPEEAHLGARAGKQSNAMDPNGASRSTCTPASMAWPSSWMGRTLRTSFPTLPRGSAIRKREPKPITARNSRSVVRSTQLDYETTPYTGLR